MYHANGTSEVANVGISPLILVDSESAATYVRQSTVFVGEAITRISYVVDVRNVGTSDPFQTMTCDFEVNGVDSNRVYIGVRDAGTVAITPLGVTSIDPRRDEIFLVVRNSIMNEPPDDDATYLCSGVPATYNVYLEWTLGGIERTSVAVGRCNNGQLHFPLNFSDLDLGIPGNYTLTYRIYAQDSTGIQITLYPPEGNFETRQISFQR